MISPDERRGLVADRAKVLGGLAILAAGLVLVVRLSNSDARRGSGFHGVRVNAGIQ